MRSPYTQKIINATIITSIVALLSGVLLFVVFDAYMLRRAMMDEVQTLADMTIENNKNILKLNANPKVKKILGGLDDEQGDLWDFIYNERLKALESLKHNKKIIAACLYISDNYVFSSFARDDEIIDFENLDPREGLHIENGVAHLLVPIDENKKELGSVYIQYDVDYYFKLYKDRYLTIILAVLMVTILVAMLLAIRLQRNITYPITDLLETAKRAVEGKIYSNRAKIYAEDEVGALADNFNQLLGEMQKQDKAIMHKKVEMAEIEERLKRSINELASLRDQLIQSEKLAVVGKLASGVSHEVKNPLAIILQGVEFLSKKIPKDDKNSRDILADVYVGIQKANFMIKSILDYSGLSDLDTELKDINTVLDSALLLVKYKLVQNKIEVYKDYEENIKKVNINYYKMEQVFVNLLLNAVQAIKDDGKIYIKTYAKELTLMDIGVGSSDNDPFREGDLAVVVEIDDNGIGIPRNKMRDIFKPFFTTKKHKGGTGLGMSIIKNIIELHKGTIAIKNREEGGVKAIVMLKV